MVAEVASGEGVVRVSLVDIALLELFGKFFPGFTVSGNYN